MPNEYEKSLGDQNTFPAEAKPSPKDFDTRSLGDQATFAGENIGDAIDDGIEIVDIAARYQIEKTLGKGGMGEVLLATDTRLDRQVAIKRIRGESNRSKTAVNRFLTEAKAIAALSHPNIVHINDYGRDKEGPFLIMEYVDGGSLLDRCREGAIPNDQAIDLVSQLCDGLAKAHDRGIIHRDIKPANILLTKDGIPKLTDFGLAKAETSDTSMTMAGSVLGTLDFMPPEQRRDAALADARSDLWSLAATLYQMVTGESPRVIDLDLCPKELRSVLSQGLKTKKEDRYQTAREFRDALKRSLDTTQVSNPEQLITGECPKCHAKNDASRKFCRGCAQPLEVACLGCNAKMPIWENICGECGTKQLELLQPRREALQANRDAAIASLEALDFEKARALATKVQDETDPRLQNLHPWCTEFFTEIEKRRTQELEHVKELGAEANSHEQAHDYAAAIRTLEQVPESLRGTLIDGIGITVASMLKHLEAIEKKRHQLETQIRLLVAKREMNGLPELVAELLEITPDRKDLLRLKSQLEERTAKLIAIRDEAFTEAQSKRHSQDYEGALSELDKIDPSVIEPSMVAAKSEIQQTIREIDELLRSINNDVNAKRYAGLLAKVNRVLELKSDHEEMQQLRAQLVERESQSVEKVKQLVSNAEDYRRSIHFEDALKLLLTIPMEYRTEATNALADSCSQLETERKRAFENLRRGIKDGHHEEALSGIRSYQSLLNRYSLNDAALSRLIPEFQKEIERSEANRAIAKQVLIAVLAIGVPAVFIGSIVAINIQSRWVEEQAQLAVMQAEKDAKEAEMVRLATEKAEQERIAAEKAEQQRIAKEKALQALEPITNSIGMKLKLIPSGEFMMGEGGEMHRVSISKRFYLGIYEVTQDEYQRLMGKNPSKFKSARNPVELVSWEDAVAFCGKLSDLPEEKKARRVYRLPTEAEWEYACKAGSNTVFSFGQNAAALPEFGWYNMNSKQRTHTVGTKLSNPWGLYDMHGNVWEWCSDWYSDYPITAVTDPVGPKQGSGRVRRGGGWFIGAVDCRSATRHGLTPSSRFDFLGFRVAMSPSEIPK
jgi:serine/threonine protein kinase/formylglycine-generating enzyme required for sulfatase activity